MSRPTKFNIIKLTVALVLIGSIFMNYRNIEADEDSSEDLSMSQNITNSPGAKAYQAGRDMYVNPKKPDRHLTNNLISQIDNEVNDAGVKEAKILYISGNAEAKQFASEIADYLKSKGLSTKGPYPAMFIGDSMEAQSMSIDKNGILKFQIRNYNN